MAKFTANREGKASLTDQAEKYLRKVIAKGSRGDVLPSERELAQAAGIARNCVRHAYDRLVDEGLIKTGNRVRLIA